MEHKSKFKLGFGKNNGGFMHVIDETFDEILNESKDGFAITKSELKTFRDKKKIDFTSFEPQDELNPKIWDSNGLLNPRVRMRLLDIADTFIDGLDIDWVEIDDIILKPGINKMTVTGTGNITIQYNFTLFYIIC